jgi:ribonuclease HII
MVPLEHGWWQEGLRVAGVDEAGRGALAGPVVVGVVILPAASEPYPFRDSKTLSASQRKELKGLVHSVALAHAVAFAEAEEVDQLGVLRATHLAAQRALKMLSLQPQALLTDYLKLSTALPIRHPAKADRDSPTVAAASILAKVARDQHMEALDVALPGYGFAVHKGYGTAAHLAALKGLGPSGVHRRSFAPVAACLQTPL